MGKIMTAGDFSNLLIQSCNTINDSTLRTNLTNQIKTFATFKSLWNEMCSVNSGTFPNPDTFQRCLWYGIDLDEYLDISGLANGLVNRSNNILSSNFIFNKDNTYCENIFNRYENYLIDYDNANGEWEVKFVDSFPHYESVLFHSYKTSDNSYIIDPDTQCNLTLSFADEYSVITNGYGSISGLTFTNPLGVTLKESDYRWMTNSHQYKIRLQIYDTNLVDKNNGSDISLTDRENDGLYVFNIASDEQTTSSYHTITAYSESSFPLSVIRNDITDIFFNYNTIAQNVPDTEITVTIFLQAACLERGIFGTKYSILSNATPRTDQPIRLYNSIWDGHGANSGQIAKPYSFTYTSNTSGRPIKFTVKKREMESFLSYGGMLYGTLNVSIPMRLSTGEYFRIIAQIPNFNPLGLTGTTYNYTASDVMLSMTTRLTNGDDGDHTMKLYYNQQLTNIGDAYCYVMRDNINRNEIKTKKIGVPSTVSQFVVPSRIYIVDSKLPSGADTPPMYNIQIKLDNSLGDVRWNSFEDAVQEEDVIYLLGYFADKNYSLKQLLTSIGMSDRKSNGNVGGVEINFVDVTPIAEIAE